MVLCIVFLLLSILVITCLSIITFNISPFLILLYILLFPIIYGIIFCIYVVLLFVFTLFISKKKPITKPNFFFNSLLKQSIHELFRFANIKIHFISNGLVDKNKKYVIVCNHISNFDPMIIIDQMKQKIICISKPENEKIPICGALMHKSGFILIDRNNAFKAAKSINLAVKYINDYNCSILIFPEGTRNKEGIGLLPFHPGSFKIGIKANVPTLICSIKNTNKIHKNFPFKRTHIYIEFLGVINVDEYDNMNTIQMVSKAEELINNNLNK